MTYRTYGIWCTLKGAAAGSDCGAAECWLKKDGIRVEFDTVEEARAKASEIQSSTASTNLTYRAREIEGWT